MIELKKNNKIVLKNLIINSFMGEGKKRTGEKILLKLLKLLQKSKQKNLGSLVQFVICNLAPAFKLNEQTLKKGKRKSQKAIPSFITKDSLRIMTVLKCIRNITRKDKSRANFHEKVFGEILKGSMLNGALVEQKAKLQNQVSLNKRYLAKFRW